MYSINIKATSKEKTTQRIIAKEIKQNYKKFSNQNVEKEEKGNKELRQIEEKKKQDGVLMPNYITNHIK